MTKKVFRKGRHIFGLYGGPPRVPGGTPTPPPTAPEGNQNTGGTGRTDGNANAADAEPVQSLVQQREGVDDLGRGSLTTQSGYEQANSDPIARDISQRGAFDHVVEQFDGDGELPAMTVGDIAREREATLTQVESDLQIRDIEGTPWTVDQLQTQDGRPAGFQISDPDVARILQFDGRSFTPKNRSTFSDSQITDEMFMGAVEQWYSDATGQEFKQLPEAQQKFILLDLEGRANNDDATPRTRLRQLNDLYGGTQGIQAARGNVGRGSTHRWTSAAAAFDTRSRGISARDAQLTPQETEQGLRGPRQAAQQYLLELEQENPDQAWSVAFNSQYSDLDTVLGDLRILTGAEGNTQSLNLSDTIDNNLTGQPVEQQNFEASGEIQDAVHQIIDYKYGIVDDLSERTVQELEIGSDLADLRDQIENAPEDMDAEELAELQAEYDDIRSEHPGEADRIETQYRQYELSRDIRQMEHDLEIAQPRPRQLRDTLDAYDRMQSLSQAEPGLLRSQRKIDRELAEASAAFEAGLSGFTPEELEDLGFTQDADSGDWDFSSEDARSAAREALESDVSFLEDGISESQAEYRALDRTGNFDGRLSDISDAAADALATEAGAAMATSTDNPDPVALRRILHERDEDGNFVLGQKVPVELTAQGKEKNKNVFEQTGDAFAKGGEIINQLGRPIQAVGDAVRGVKGLVDAFRGEDGGIRKLGGDLFQSVKDSAGRLRSARDSNNLSSLQQTIDQMVKRERESSGRTALREKVKTRADRQTARGGMLGKRALDQRQQLAQIRLNEAQAEEAEKKKNKPNGRAGRNWYA